MTVPAVPDPADLAAQAPDLRAALSRFLDRHLLELNAVLDEVEARANGAAPLGDGAAYERRLEEYRLLAAGMRDSVRALTAAVRDPVADPAERPVEQLSWRALSTTAARDEETAQELWEAVRACLPSQC